MDLEYFPWSQTANRMLGTVSPIYDKSYVGKWIFEVIGGEFDFVKEHFNELCFQSLPQTATWGLTYWEMLLKLPDQPSLGTEERRQHILGKLLNKAPMNPARVEQLVEATTGYPATVVENVAPYIFSVDLFDIKEAGYHKVLRELLQRVKPSHLSYLISASFPVIALENRERIRLAILFHLKVGNLSDYVYLDGRYNLDGAWLLTTQDFRGVKLDSLYLEIALKNVFQAIETRNFAFFISLCSVLNRAELSCIRLRLYEQNRQRCSEKVCLYCVKTRTQMKISVTITVDTIYYLDNQFYLDGSRKLNANIERNEI